MILQTESKNMMKEQDFETKQRLESLGLLSGEIAHDLNNMLTSILGNTELADYKTPDDSLAKEHLEEIRQATLYASELVKQILSYIASRENNIALLDLNAIMADLCPLLDAAIPKGVEIHHNKTPKLPLFKGNQAQIKQIVINLINNAVEAIGNDDGQIYISTSVDKLDKEDLTDIIEGHHHDSGEYISLRISDTGVGISHDLRSKIFNPLFTTKQKGHGLGLAAVLSIVHSHSGILQMQSTPEQGTTFRIHFPIAAHYHTESPDKDTLPEFRGSGTVLLIDDTVETLAVTHKLLEYLGFDVKTAHSGEQALTLLSKYKDDITVVLLDVCMPGMSGEETALQFRKAGAEIPIILTSGRLLDADVSAANGFLLKPFQLSELIAAFRKVFAKNPSSKN